MPSDVDEEMCKYPIEKKLHVDNLICKIKEYYQSIESDKLRNPISYAAPKSFEDAKCFRQTGIADAEEGNHTDSYTMLNMALTSAPLDSVEVNLTYAARSATAFSAGYYISCIKDVEHALTSNKLSEKMRKELRKRKKDAASQRQRQLFDKKGRPSCKHYTRAFSLELKAEYLQKKSSSEPLAFDSFDADNVCLPQTTSLVKFLYKKNASSYIIADKDIQAGTVISAEKCFSKTLNESCRLSHCSFCFLLTPFLIPCSTCSQVMYCSVVCQHRAYESYHRTECKMINFCKDDAIQQAIQVLLVGTKQGKRLSKLMKTMTPYDIMIGEFRPPSKLRFKSDYSTFLNTIRDKRLWDETNNLWREMTVPLVVDAVIALRNISFFGDESGVPDHLSEKEMFVALLLIDHYTLLNKVGYKISSQLTPTTDTPISFTQPIAEAFFAVQNLIGRSCYPNCRSFMECDHRFLFTTRYIRAGEMLYFAETNLYVEKSLEERIAGFANSRFICECEACLQKWPSISDLKAQKIVFRKKKQKDIVISLLERERDNAISLISKDNKNGFPTPENDPKLQILTTTAEVISEMCSHEFCKNPSYDLIMLETLLHKIMTTMYSDFCWLNVPVTKDFDDTFCLILTRLESAEINWSGKEDSSECLQFEKEVTIEIPHPSEVHETTSDVAEEEDDTTTMSVESEEMLNQELEAGNKLYKTLQDWVAAQIGSNNEGEGDEKNENLFLKIRTTVFPEDNSTKELAKKSVEVCSIEDPVREKRLCVKTIDELRSEFHKKRKTEKTSCKENIGVDQYRDTQREIDQKTLSGGASRTIGEESTIGYAVDSNTKTSVGAKVNEASFNSCNEKINEETLDEATLLALIDDIYQSQLGSSSIIDQRYADFKSEVESNQLQALAKIVKKRVDKDMAEMQETHNTLCSSIAFAPNGSQELALGYAARSAILFKMNEVKGCLLDVNRSIALGKCPKPVMKILRERKKECLRILNTDRRNEDQPSLNCNTTDPCVTECQFTKKFSYSPKLKMSENNTSGFVAIELIMPGEELMKEKYEVATVDQFERFSYCSHCLSRSMALIPCSSCTQFMFCSEKCRWEAYESYHRSECQIAKFYDRDGLQEMDTIEIVALRSFFVGTRQGKYIPELLSLFKRLYDSEEEATDSGKLTFVEDFLIALNDDKSLIKRLKATLPHAVEMVMALRSFAFFSQEYSKPLPRMTEEEVLSTLLVAMNLIAMKNDRKFHVEAQAEPADPTETKRIGWAIYIKQNLVRHSCYPNTIEVHRQGYRYLYSSRVIEEGEQVTFGDMFLLRILTPELRKQRFALQGWTCECEACLEAWPSATELWLRKLQFKDDKSKESVITSLKEVRNKYSNTIHVDELQALIKDCISVLCDGLKGPSPDIILFQGVLALILKTQESERRFDSLEAIRKLFITSYIEVMKRLNSTKY